MDAKTRCEWSWNMGFIRSFRRLHEKARKERSFKKEQKVAIKDMPYVYGLLAVCLSSGLSPEESLRRIFPYAPGVVKEHIGKSIRRIDAGQSFRESLASWEDNVHLRALSHSLAESVESGTSSIIVLDALGRDAMSRVRRHSDVALKKLPITMLFPLVTCILPAFILLSVVPTLINGFMSSQI